MCPKENIETTRARAKIATLALPRLDFRCFAIARKFTAMWPPAPTRKSHENHSWAKLTYPGTTSKNIRTPETAIRMKDPMVRGVDQVRRLKDLRECIGAPERRGGWPNEGRTVDFTAISLVGVRLLVRDANQDGTYHEPRPRLPFPTKRWSTRS